MNTTLTAFLNDLISSSIACSPKGSLHIKSSYDLTGASPKTRRAVQLGYHSTQTKSAGILDNVMNEVSTNKALQAGLAGAVVGGGLTALTGKSDPEETATHRALKILGNATLAGGLTGAAAYGIPKGIAEFSEALPKNDINPVDRIAGSNPVRGLTTLGGIGVVSGIDRKRPSIFNAYSNSQLEQSARDWKTTGLPPGTPADVVTFLKAQRPKKDIPSLAQVRLALDNKLKTTPDFFDTAMGVLHSPLKDQLIQAGINTEQGFKGRAWFEAKNLGRNLKSMHGLTGLARLGAGAAAGYFAPDVFNAVGEKLYDTVTKH